MPTRLSIDAAGTPGTATAVTMGNASALIVIVADETRDVLILCNVSDTAAKLTAGSDASALGLTDTVYAIPLAAGEAIILEGQLAEKAWWSRCDAATKKIVYQAFSH